MKSFRLATAAFVVALGLTTSVAFASGLADIQKSKTIVIVTTSTSPPHGFKDPVDGAHKGIMVEIALGVAKRLGVTPQIVDVPFAGLVPTLTTNRADLMASPLFITEERAKVIDFTDSIYGWGEGVAQSEKNSTTYLRTEDMKGARIGTLADSVQFRMAKTIPDSKVSSYSDYPMLLADVRAGRIDFGIVDPPSIAYQITSKGIPGVKLASGYKPTNNWRVGMAVQKGQAPLLAAVNAALKSMQDDGEIDVILKKWGVSDLVTR